MDSIVPIIGTVEGGSDGAARAADVLLILMTADAPLGVTQVARRLGVAKSVAFRALRSLSSRGLVEQAPDTHDYRLGPAAVALGVRALTRSDLETVSVPHLQGLRDATRETVLLSRTVAGGRVHVAQYLGPQSVRMSVELGVFRPWHAGASGKILLAHVEEAVRDRIIAQEAEEYSLSENSLSRLHSQLRQARECGHAVSGAERNPDAGAVAAPIFGRGGVVIAAVSVCGPLSRMGPAATAAYAPLVMEAARTISMRVSGSASS